MRYLAIFFAFLWGFQTALLAFDAFVFMGNQVMPPLTLFLAQVTVLPFFILMVFCLYVDALPVDKGAP
jgi:hypothetical protein